MGRKLHPAERYCREVTRGKITACKWVKLAAIRHMEDMKTGQERGLFFDEAAAQRVLDFFWLLRHSKGEWAGRRLELEPWQQFILWSIFGWMRGDGTRRFRSAYVEVARKNGKSTKGAGVGLYLLTADGEPGAEIYSAATKRDQARITHSEATRMVKASAPLKKYVTIFRDNLHIKNTASKFEPLGADTDSMDGLNVHGAIVDELHAHKNRETWDLLETATGSRRQPLMFGITTAGMDRHSLCWDMHEYAEKVLSGVIEDDTFFGIIYTLDEGDDWQEEKNWIKANPNLGVSKKLDDMRTKARQAMDMPSKQANFLRRELNVWVQAETKWMNMEHWKACGSLPVDLEALKGRKCYGGLDLSSNLDISAWVLAFEPLPGEQSVPVLARFFVPEENIYKRAHDDRVPYDVWNQQGFIRSTPGNVIDYDFIFDQIEQDAEQYDLAEIAFDRWGASSVVTDLQEVGLTVVSMGQGFASMSPPMKELERLVASILLAHGNNPVLTWMADNLVAKLDPAGNIKPDKDKSRERIDGMTALIMALDRLLRNEAPGESVYAQDGLVTL